MESREGNDNYCMVDTNYCMVDTDGNLITFCSQNVHNELKPFPYRLKGLHHLHLLKNLLPEGTMVPVFHMKKLRSIRVYTMRVCVCVCVCVCETVVNSLHHAVMSVTSISPSLARCLPQGKPVVLRPGVLQV